MSDKAFEEWWKPRQDFGIIYETNEATWHASRKQAVEEMIEILEKYRCDGAPHDDNFFPAEDLLDEIRKRFDYK